MWNSKSSGGCRRAKPRTTRLRRSRAIDRVVWTPKRPVSTTSTSTWSARAAASTSNPGPRLAEEAGTRMRRRRLTRRRSRTEHRPLHRADVGLAGDDGARVAEGDLRILEAVAGEHADDPARLLGAVLQQARHPGGRGRLAEDALVRGEPAVRVEDLGVGDGADRAVRRGHRAHRLLPARGVADPDRARHGLGVLDGLAVHERRRPLRLPA